MGLHDISLQQLLRSQYFDAFFFRKPIFSSRKINPWMSTQIEPKNESLCFFTIFSKIRLDQQQNCVSVFDDQRHFNHNKMQK